MRKIFLLGMLIVGLNSFAQGTTQKEFNYASKGYADDLAMGKDIIAGYSIEELGRAGSKVIEAGNKSIERITKIYKLVRKGNNTVAAFIIEERRVDNNNVVYSCLPNSVASVDLWNQAQDVYFKKIQAYKCEGQGMAFAYDWNVLKILSNSLTIQ